MGMFDTYIPDPQVSCPRCGATVSLWQGYDAQCVLNNWQQGKMFPISTDWPAEDIEGDLETALQSCAPLPPEFKIVGWCDKCEGNRPIIARGRCLDGIWTQLEIESWVK